MSEYILAITTCRPKEAQVLARRLVESKTCACVNIITGVNSIYHWKDEIHQDNEVILYIKTEHCLLEKLQTLLLAVHPYDVPEFIVLPIVWGSNDYLKWISDSVKNGEGI